jgi:hypothetical protein
MGHGGHGHGGHGRGRRFFGGGYGGGWWGPCYGYDAFGNCYPVEVIGMDAHALAGFHRGHLYRHSAPPDGQLPALAPLLTLPSATPARIEMELSGHELTVAIEIDGKAYRGTADLSQVFDVAKTYLEAYHQALHRRGTMLVGRAPSASELAAPIADDTVKKAADLLVGALVEQHRREHVALCCGWFDSITNAVKSAANGIEHAASSAVGEVGHTLSKLKGPIETAAAGAASAAALGIPGVGPLVAPLAGSLAKNIVDAAAGSGSSQKAAQKVVQQAAQAAQKNPQVAAALDSAHQAVAQATAGYHTAQTFANAAAGDANAQGQVAELVQAADSGDAGAASALDSAQTVADDIGSGSDDGAQVSGGGSPAEMASSAAKQFPARVVGVVQTTDGNWQLQGFPDSDAADDWYGTWLNVPHAFLYVAYYDKGDSTFPGPLNEQHGHPMMQARSHGATMHHAPAEVSGWIGVLGGLMAGAAAGMYGPDAYHWLRGKIASKPHP